MDNFDLIEFKVPKDGIKQDCDFPSVLSRSPRGSNYGLFASGAIETLEALRLCNKTVHVNQDGLRSHDASRATKLAFKTKLRKFRQTELHELPDPFTGRIEFHGVRSLLKVIKFYSVKN